MEVMGSSPVGSTNNEEKNNKVTKEQIASIKLKLQDLNTCLQDNRGLMCSDAFYELDIILSTTLNLIEINLD
jgi:hypothetical protein